MFFIDDAIKNGIRLSSWSLQAIGKKVRLPEPGKSKWADYVRAGYSVETAFKLAWKEIRGEDYGI